MSPLLPSTLWTVSTCICDTLPDSWAIPWSQDSHEELAAARRLLGLTADRFKLMQTHVEELLARRYGWPNVFLDLTAAREFLREYAADVPQIRLLGISLPIARLDRFLSEGAPFKEQAAPGIFEAASARTAPAAGGSLRGFEVLAYEHGAFHSFICNGLESEYASRGLQLNEASLLPSLGDAERATEFTMLDSTGAEPVPWEAWKIDEYSAPDTTA